MSQIEQDAEKFAKILVALAPILLHVPNEVSYDGQQGYALKLGGFYKDGQIVIRSVLGGGTMGQGLYTITGRYEQLSEIYPGEDLLDEVIKLNADRFRYWSEVKPEFKDIDPSWLPILLERGLVEPVVTTTYKIR